MKFDGMKEDGTIVNSELNRIENEYKYFDDTTTAKWKYLIFTVLKLNQRTYTVSKGKVYNDTCPICLEGVGNNLEEIYIDIDSERVKTGVQLSCCHQYHQKCIDEWFATGKTSCPLCNK